jgi:hypothetical protein
MEALDLKPEDYEWSRDIDMGVRSIINGPRLDVSYN